MKRTPHQTLLLFALTALACGTLPLRAAPVVIDLFSNDLASITSDTSLDGTMLGGEIDLYLTLLDAATFEIAGGSGTLSGVTETGGANNAQLVYDGENNGTGYAFGLPSVDFTDGGSNDRFAIVLSSVTGTIDVQVRVFEDLVHFSSLIISGVTSAGIVEFPFADFTNAGSGADFAASKQVAILVNVDTGEGFSIDSFIAMGPTPPVATPDTVRPGIRFLNKGRLGIHRPRHRIRGFASDNVAVAKVEVKAKGKGWRKASLRADGRWIYRTPRLKAGKNLFLARAQDTSGNRSQIKSVRARGL